MGEYDILIIDLISEVKSAIVIPKNSPFTQAKPPRLLPRGFCLCIHFYFLTILCYPVAKSLLIRIRRFY